MQIAICTHRSAKACSVPDSTTDAINRFFDHIDNAVDTADRVLNRSKYTEDKLQDTGKRAKRRQVIDAESAAPSKPAPSKPATSKAQAIAKKQSFYIVESVDPTSGNTLFVVTDGGNARTKCATREFATQILRALEKAP